VSLIIERPVQWEPFGDLDGLEPLFIVTSLATFDHAIGGLTSSSSGGVTR
jgi:hypothetical protein|tara:strand:- start:231 stop:380 length:150 start_codon:yes stop_codon:yes gene_type:complete